MATKKLKTHTTSARKKSSLTSSRSKKAASKATKSKAAKKKADELKRRKELGLLAHKMFGMVYEDYQQGKFHRIL
ncbi:MAG TPA: hypothetical protein VIW74_04055 [Pyrinomonadaceae bacterium]|jgi:hypothetical protein